MRCPISIVSCHKNEARATELDEGPRIGEKVCRITAQGGAGVTVFWSNQRNIPATSRPLDLSRSGTGSKPCESKKFAGCGIERRCVICTLVKGGDLFGAPYQRHTVRARPRNRNNFFYRLPTQPSDCQITRRTKLGCTYVRLSKLTEFRWSTIISVGK
jgi:hypothetical protein